MSLSVHRCCTLEVAHIQEKVCSSFGLIQLFLFLVLYVLCRSHAYTGGYVLPVLRSLLVVPSSPLPRYSPQWTSASALSATASESSLSMHALLLCSAVCASLLYAAIGSARIAFP